MLGSQSQYSLIEPGRNLGLGGGLTSIPNFCLRIPDELMSKLTLIREGSKW